MAEKLRNSDKIQDIPNFVAVCLITTVVVSFVLSCLLGIDFSMIFEWQYGYIVPFSLLCGLFAAYVIDMK